MAEILYASPKIYVGTSRFRDNNNTRLRTTVIPPLRQMFLEKFRTFATTRCDYRHTILDRGTKWVIVVTSSPRATSLHNCDDTYAHTRCLTPADLGLHTRRVSEICLQTYICLPRLRDYNFYTQNTCRCNTTHFCSSLGSPWVRR